MTNAKTDTTTLTGLQLREEAYALLSQAPEDEGDEHAWLDLLCGWADQTDDKLGAYRSVVRASKARIDDFDAEIKRWQAAKRRQEHAAERCSYQALALLLDHEALTGERHLELSSGGKAMIQRRVTTAVEIVDEYLVPREYVREVVVSKSVAKPVLEAGEEIPGLALKENTSTFVRWS